MPLRPYTPKTRLTPERVTLTQRQLAARIGQQQKVSAEAINSALTIITKGITDALANGYDVTLRNLGTFQIREIPSRPRYMAFTKKHYIAQPTLIAHFQKSKTLLNFAKRMANEQLGELRNKNHVKKVVAL